jgi:RNA 3'-terminal phosphate cyclase (ATP)
MDEQIESNGNMKMIELDGSIGEGGGQILRTALSLSMVTGIPFRIDRIRAKRSKPGLLRQHLTSVNAATEICGAHTEGAVLGSTCLTFTPGPVKAGEYKFAIGSAGSCTLVFQTVLPALMLANGVSRVTFEGGTHNQMAPPFHFIEHAFLPQLQLMGVTVDARLERFGFYPAGGGRFTANITPVGQGVTLKPTKIESRGTLINGFAESFFAGVPAHVAERELATVGRIMSWADEKLFIRGIDNARGPGNVVLLTLKHEHVTEVFAGFGEKGISSETVATRVANEARSYLASDAAIGEHLADQLMIPSALAGGGSFTAVSASEHARTNAEVIQKFLAVEISIAAVNLGNPHSAVRFGFSR